MLKPGGRAAVIVPDGVLFGSSKAHKELRRLLVDGHKLDAVISLPSGAFKPYAGVSTAILVFTKTNSGGTDRVWFYDLRADGWSLDDKRQPLLSEDKLGPVPGAALSEAEHAMNNLPDALRRWRTLNPLPLPLVVEGRGEGLAVNEPGVRYSEELSRPRTAQSFCVPRAEIESNGYDLSLNRYQQVVHDAAEHRAPSEIVVELLRLEAEIQRGIQGMAELLQ